MEEKSNNTTAKAATPKKAATIKVEPKRPNFWKRNSVRPIRWQVYSITNCDLTPVALALLKEHEEPHVGHSIHSEYSAQEAITKGHNYSPLIYKDGVLFGSLGDLENYYKRNFFSSMQEATQ